MLGAFAVSIIQNPSGLASFWRLRELTAALLPRLAGVPEEASGFPCSQLALDQECGVPPLLSLHGGASSLEARMIPNIYRFSCSRLVTVPQMAFTHPQVL